MMKRRYMRTVKVKDTKSRDSFILDYFLLEEGFPVGQKMNVITYGISVMKSKDGLKETADAPSLFIDENDAMELLDLIARNSVTPISLNGIIEDFLAGTQQKRKIQTRIYYAAV